MTTAPDPGLTDRIGAALYAAIAKAAPSGSVTVEDMTESLLPVVEQHTNGRMASDLGADPQDYEIAWAAKLRWQARAEKAEATIARVEALRDNRRMHDYYGPGQPFVAVYDLRAALEGEQR